MITAPAAREVEVRYRFAGDEATAEDLDQLSAEERARAARFLVGRDRASFAAAHALARRMIAAAAGVESGALTFQAGEYGKPAVTGPGPASALSFNLAHTRGLVACAVCRGGEVGVDVEAVRDDVQPADLARRFFAASECRVLDATPASERPARFTDLWALKEAYIKAVGLGLSHPLESFAFDFLDGGRLSFVPPPGDAASRVFALFAPAPRFRLAIAAPGGYDVRVTDDDARATLQPMYTGAAGGTSDE